MKIKTAVLFTITITTFSSLLFGFGGGVVGFYVARELDKDDEISGNDVQQENVSIISEDSAVIDVAQKASDSVVSIIITAEVPLYEEYLYDPFGSGFGIPQQRQNGTEERQVGAGSGFVITEDGTIVTNRHVVSNEDASYTVIFNDGETMEAEIVARDTVLDIAFLKVEKDGLTPLELGSSDNLKTGQTVIAIGNALGEFSNTVSLGIVSGLSREIVASDSNGASSELLSDVIQTDASINPGNSGGPLLDITGKVVGVNVAVASEGENIAFSIPIDSVKDLLSRLDENGNIDRPILGIRYTQVNKKIKAEQDLSVDYGALIVEGSTEDESGIVPNSPADEAGLKVGDVILEIDRTKVDENNTVQKLIQSKFIDDQITIKYLRDEEEFEVDVTLFKF